ncbi:STAS/SEC14 domain-containing protein [Rhodococcus spelaei]|uniref:STAS/SEC14 domain-containing protein n=1 Tax=Rhodococcus spelaei TaxID=2546320 RepID=UPI00338F47E3
MRSNGSSGSFSRRPGRHRGPGAVLDRTVGGAGFGRYSLGAMWRDARMIGVSRDAGGRLALVTDRTGLGEAGHLPAFLIPGELRVFAANWEADAIGWIASD